jgi:hypothetical protein
VPRLAAIEQLCGEFSAHWSAADIEVGIIPDMIIYIYFLMEQNNGISCDSSQTLNKSSTAAACQSISHPTDAGVSTTYNRNK